MNTLTVNRNRQRGVILLVLVFAVFAIGATLFLSSVNSHTVEIRRHQDVRAELIKAKQALIAYAMNYHTFGFDYVDDGVIMDEGPGRLLCPDVDNDGVANSNSTDCTDYVRGRLPEDYSNGGNSIDINDTFESIDQQFWYVVSPAFKEIATTSVNHQTTGNLSIDGEPGFVAVIIAPGAALSYQDRSMSQTSAANYLELGNLAGASFSNFYPIDPDDPNDQVIGIKASELMLAKIRGNYDGSVALIYEPTRQAVNAYYMGLGTLPAHENNLKNRGNGWRFDEGYLDISISGFFRDASYPYVRYNIGTCTTYWYWYIPVSPYSPNNTYVSGTPC